MLTGLLLVILVMVLAGALSLLWFQGFTGVPPMPATPNEMADVLNLLGQANLGKGAVIYDLGCGWGSIVVALARAFPDARIRGIEISPVPFWVARFRTQRWANVTLTRGNFFKCKVSDADAIICHLMMKPMPKVAAYLDGMVKAGTPVIALTFWFRGRAVTSSRKGPGFRGDVALYVWPAGGPT